MAEDQIKEGLDQAGGAPEDFAHAVLRLAELERHEYDGVRKEEADKLSVRVSTLDAAVEKIWRSAEAEAKPGNGQDLKLPEPEPWPEPVNGAELLDDIVIEFRRYLVLPDYAAEVLALWAVHAHAFEAAYITPRLTITSPLPRCGKSTVLFILWPLTVRPLHAANLTPATIFRTVDIARPTLLVDEADTFLDDQGELAGILNSGHCRDGAVVIRLVGDNHEPKTFSTWAPCTIAKIGKLTGALADRAIEVQMRRKHRNETVEQFRRDRADSLKVLGRKAARWAADNFEVLRVSDPDVPNTLNDRQSDNWRTLLAIADAAGGSWPARARAAAVHLSTEDSDEDSIKTLLLQDIQAVFDHLGLDRMSSADLCNELVMLEERPWAAWGRAQKPITANQLSRLLKPFGVRSKNLRTLEGKVVKGYEIAAFEDAFNRYLSLFPLDTPDQSATPLHSQKTAAHSGFQTATSGGDVAFRNGPKPAENSQCSGVADEIGVPREEDKEDEVPGPGSNNEKPSETAGLLELPDEIEVPDEEDVEREGIQNFDGTLSRPRGGAA